MRSIRPLPIVCIMLMLQNFFCGALIPAACADPINLDLSSTQRNVPAPVVGGSHSIVIRTGNGMSAVRAGSMLTPAQYAAASQVRSTGRQTLQVGALGQAVGGNLSSFANINDLIIPRGVSLLQNVGTNASMTFSGNLLNAGNLYAYSTNPTTTVAQITAANIRNAASGVISSVLPLSLHAAGEISNEGTIKSSGTLSLVTPKVINHGTIASLNSNVNFASNENLLVDNSGGTISAPNGDINFRTPDFVGKQDLNIVGGQAAARNFNLYSGDGHVKVDMDRIDAAVNIQAGTSVVTAHGGNLQVNSVKLSGDPAFFNTAGDVTITGNWVFPGQDLAIVASHDVLVSGPNGSNFQISTANAVGDGGDITVVAGARFTSVGSLLSIQGASDTGGQIKLLNSFPDPNVTVSVFDASSNAGNFGDIRLVAYKGTDPTSGNVILQQTTNINSPAATGTAGTVSVFGEGKIQLGPVTTGGGKVQLQNSSPVIAGGANGTFDLNDGSVDPSSGSFARGPTSGSGQWFISNITTKGGDVTLVSGGSTNYGGISAGTGAVNIKHRSSAFFGDSLSIAQIFAGSINVDSNRFVLLNGTFKATTGDINMIGNSLSGSGSIDASAGPGDVRLSGIGSINGDITSGTGRIVIRDGDVASVAGLRTAGGNIDVDVAGSFTAKYLIASDHTNYGAVSVRADSINVNGSEGNSQYANESAPANNSIVGSSVMIESKAAGAVIKPVDNTGALSYATDLGVTVADSIAVSNSVNLVQGSGDITLSNFSGSGVDFVAVTPGNISGAASPIVVQAPLGQIAILAGAQYAITGGILKATGSTGAAGNIDLVNATVQNGGGAELLIASMSTAPGNITLQTVQSLGGGTIRINGKGTSQLIATSAIQSLGDAGYRHGGTIEIVVDSTQSTANVSANGTGTGNGGIVNIASANIDLANNVTANAGSSGGTGGSITLTSTGAISFGGAPVTVSANAGGTADGGTISINAPNNTNPIVVDTGLLALSATGGSASSIAGNGGHITVSTKGNLSVDGTALNLKSIGDNGNGGDLTLVTQNGVLSVGNIDISGVGTGNGGTVWLQVTSPGAAPPVQIFGNIVANGGGTAGDGGTIKLLDSFFLNGMRFGFATQGLSQINFTPGTTLSASASTNGNGGTIQMWGTKFDLGGGTINLSAVGRSSITGARTHGGSIVLITGLEDGNIEIGSGSNKFAVDARGISSNGGIANGGSLQLYSLGGASIVLDASFAKLRPEGSGGAGGSLRIANLIGGPKQQAVPINTDGHFSYDTYGGPVTITGSAPLDLSANGDFAAGELILEAHSVKPVVIETNIEASATSPTQSAGRVWILNLASGGVLFKNESSITAKNLVGTGGDVNITAALVQVANSGSPLFLDVDAVTGGSVVVATTNPGDALSIDNTNAGVQLHATGYGAAMRVMSGGDLKVDVGALVHGDATDLLLSAGVISTERFVAFDGAPILLRNITNQGVDQPYLGRTGNLQVNGALNVSGSNINSDGGSITLISNSSLPFMINGAVSANSTAGNLNASAGHDAQFNGNIIVANFGSGGVTLLNTSDVVVDFNTRAGGSSTLPVPIAPALDKLPLVASAGKGIIELYSPRGPVSIQAGSMLTSVGNGAADISTAVPAGLVYIGGTTVDVPSAFNFDASSFSGNGGAVYVRSTSATDNFNLKPGEITVNVRGVTSSSGNTGNGGTISFVSGGTLNVDALALQYKPPSFGGGAGANLEFVANGGELTAVGIFDASATAGGVTAPAGSVFMKSSSTIQFESPHIEAKTNTSSAGGAIKIYAPNIHVANLLRSASLTFGSEDAVGLNVAGDWFSLQGPISLVSVGDANLNVTTNVASVTLASAVAYHGGITVTVDGGSLIIPNNASILAEYGTLNLVNTDTVNASAQIVIGEGAFLASSGSSAAMTGINVVIGSVPVTPSGSNDIANVTATRIAGGQTLYNGNVTATGGASSTQAIAAMSNIVFDNQSTGGGAISIQGASTGAATRIQSVVLENLDLGNAATSTYIDQLKAANVLSNSAGYLVIPQYVQTRELSSLRVPQGTAIRFLDLNSFTPVHVALSDASSYPQVYIDGGLSATQDLPMIITSTQTNVSTGFLETWNGFVIVTGDLHITSQPNFQMNVFGSQIMARTATIEQTAGTMSVGTIQADSITLISAPGVPINMNGTGGLISHVINVSAGGPVGTSSPLLVYGLEGPGLVVSVVQLPGCSNCDASLRYFPSESFQGKRVPIYLGPVSVRSLSVSANRSILAAGGIIDSPLSISLSSSGGMLGTLSSPFVVNTASVSLFPSGDSYGYIGVENITNGPNTVIPINAGNSVYYNASGSPTITAFNSVTSARGNITLMANGGSLVINPTSQISAVAGAITIQNSSPTGTISIGSNASILTKLVGGANIRIFVGPSLTQTNHAAPANVTSLEVGAGSITFGANNIVANPAQNFVSALGTGANIAFDAGSSASNITLGGGVKIDAIGFERLTSFDLNDPAVIAQVNDLETQGVIPISGSTIILRPFVFAPTLSAWNVPAGNTVQLVDFNGNTPINVSLDNASTTSGVLFTGGNVDATGSADLVLNISSSRTAPILELRNNSILSGTRIEIHANNSATQPVNIGIGSAGTISVSEILDLNTVALVMDQASLSAPLLHVSSSSALTVSASMATQLTSNVTVFGAQGGNLSLNSAPQFSSHTVLQAPAGNVVLSGGALNATETIEVQSNSFIMGGQSVNARQLVFSPIGGNGSIENPDGDVVLPATMKFTGSTLTVIAKGNILAVPALRLIAAADLFLIAGHDFSGGFFSPSPSSGTLTVTGHSSSGGSIILPGVSITAATLVAVASDGLNSNGSITLANITASNGFVNIIAPGGITTGNITTSAAGGGTIRLYAGSHTEVLPNGSTTIVNGALSGALAASAVVPGSGARIQTGAIKAIGSSKAGGSFIAVADGSIKTGTIDTHGKLDVLAGVNNFSAGGNVSLNGSNILVNGSIAAYGLGTAGGGNVTIRTSEFSNSLRYGSVKITGGINASGGPGNASGAVNIDAGSMAIGILSGYSVNARDITLQTYGSQTVPSAFDLTSASANQYAMPGALFTLNTGVAVNGVRGQLKSSATILKKADVPGGKGLIFAGSSVTVPGITLTVTGQASQTIAIPSNPNFNITVANPNGVRTKVTPSAALVLFDKTHGSGQSLVLDDKFRTTTGGIAIDQIQIPDSFSSFKLPTNTSLTVQGSNVLLKMPSAPVLNGTFNFVGTNDTFMIDFGRAAVKINGAISADPTSTLVLAGSGSSWINNAMITAGTVAIVRPTTAALTLTNKGLGADVVAPNGIVLGSNETINFVGTLSNFSSKVVFGPQPFFAPKYVSKPAVNLTFATTGQPVSLGGTVFLTSLKVTEKTGVGLNILPDSSFIASTGNVVLLTKGDLTGTDNATFKGGGVELAAGTNVSKLSTVLRFRSGSITSISLGSDVVPNNGFGTHGTIQALVSGVGADIDISNGNQATINVLFGGAVMLQAQNGKHIDMSGVTITTAGGKPIASRQLQDVDSEYIVDTEFDTESSDAYTARR
jgi:hypothetical protein